MPIYYKRDATGTANWNLATSWSTVSSTSATNTGTFPSSTTLDPVIFDANSSACTVNVAATCTSITFTGYANTITMTNGITVFGNVTLANTATYLGPSGITLRTTSTFTFAGATYNLPLTISTVINTGAQTFTFADSGQVSNFSISNGGNTTITLSGVGHTLSISGNASFGIGASTTLASSTLSVLLNGTGAVTVTGYCAMNLTINATGTITLIGFLIVFAQTGVDKTLIYQNGTINWNGNSLGVHSTSGRVVSVNFPYPIFDFRIEGLFNNTGNITLLSDLNVTNLQVANWAGNSSGQMNLNGFNVYISGNFTAIQSPLSGTTKLWMVGTGTINCTASLLCSLEINSPSGNITVQRIAFGGAVLTFTYTTAAIFTQTGIISFLGTTCTFNNPGNANFTNLSFRVETNINFTVVNFNHNINCTEIAFTQSGGTTVVLNGNTINVSGNITRISSPTVIGTSTIRFVGGIGTATWAGLTYGCNFSIEKSVSFTENMTFNTTGRSVVVTGTGSVNPNAASVAVSASVSMTISNMTFWNLNLGTGVTITQNTANTINGTLTCLGNATFAGTAGWTTNNFTHGGAGFICTLQAGITYNVTGLFTMIGISSSRAVLQSNDAQNVQVTINALSNQMILNIGTIPNPSTGYVLGSRAFTGVLPTVLNDLLPNRPTILSGTANPYTLTAPINATPVPSSLLLQLGKKAFFNVATGTGSTFVAYAATRDIDSSGGIEIQAAQSYSDAIGQPSPNLFRTINWGPLIAPSGSTYYTWIK